MTNPTTNQTVTIRSMIANKPSIEGGTIVKVSTTGKKVDVACDAGIVSFYRSPRCNNNYYSNANGFNSLKLVF